MAGIINHDARSEIRAIQQQSVAVGDSQSAMWASYIGQRLDDLRALLLADTHEWPPDETRPMTREERHVFQREISRQSRKRCTTQPKENPNMAAFSALEERLAAEGVFKGFHGLDGLANNDEFWQEQPYGTRLYYGDGGADYLHRDVLRAAIRALGRGYVEPNVKLTRNSGEEDAR